MIKCPAESEVVIFFVSLILTVAPESAMLSLPVILPFIIGWENTEPIIKKRSHGSKKIDLAGSGKEEMFPIERVEFLNLRKKISNPEEL